MKKFEKMYKDYFNNINLSREEKIKMKEKIMSEKKSKFIFKFAYRLSIFIEIFLISGIMVVTANSLVRQFQVKESKSIVLENEKLDININADYLKKGDYYTHEVLENLFDIKILKNSKINSNIYKLLDLESNKGKVSKVNFANIDNKGNISNISFGFETKFYKDDNEDEMRKQLGDIWISGPTEDKEVYNYNIKTLETEAIILSTKSDVAPIIASFIYNNVVYSIETNKTEYSIEDIYSYLDAYIK